MTLSLFQRLRIFAANAVTHLYARWFIFQHQRAERKRHAITTHE